MRKQDIAGLLDDMADLLAVAGENEFKLRAYRNGAEILRELSDEQFRNHVENGTLSDLEGIGEALSDKITEAYHSGIISKFEETKETYPVSLLDLYDIHGMGPKSIRKLFDELGVETIPDLRKALQSGSVESLDGFGPKTIENIEQSLQRLDRFSGRVLLTDAITVAESLVDYLRDEADPDRIDVAGSYRRGKETVGDLDIVVTGAEDVGRCLTSHERVRDVLVDGDTKVSVLMESDIQVDLRIVAPEEYGATLLYFTGSKEHNVKLRGRARDRGWTINEYGLFNEDTGEKLAGETEESIYNKLGLDWIPPELREDNGELEAAESGTLPDLVTTEDISGDWHVHTSASDGKHTVEQMVQSAKEKGHESIVISDHSQSLRIAGGLTTDELENHIGHIREVDDHFEGIDVRSGSEVDILEDGQLDYPDELLERLDYVVAAIHQKFHLDREAQTQRIISALKHPEVDVLAHPTGRKLGEREAYDLNRDRVLNIAAERDVAIEINSNEKRLDANDRWCREGKSRGIQFVVSTDAHSREHLWFYELGVRTARRGWLEVSDVANTGFRK
ncbi:MAG: DNA polymerase/3'-5' exonuclease PolX [bacterium]